MFSCFHVSCLFLSVADPATFLASNSVPDLVFLLDGYGKNKYIRDCIITSLMSEFEFLHSFQTTQCPFNVHLFTTYFILKTSEEVNEKLNGLKLEEPFNFRNKTFKGVNGLSIPQSVDWRKEGLVSPVMNQVDIDLRTAIVNRGWEQSNDQLGAKHMSSFLLFEGVMWVLLGLQLYGSSWGSNEEANRGPCSAEPTEPGGLQH